MPSVDKRYRLIEMEENMNSENAIEIRNMSKSFKIQYDKANALKNRLVMKRNNRVEVHEVLRNINLDIKKGDTVALIGTNGSGIIIGRKYRP